MNQSAGKILVKTLKQNKILKTMSKMIFKTGYDI